MEIPCVITEQYPKAFGRTVSELLQLNNEDSSTKQQIFARRQFSMMTNDVADVLEQSGNNIITIIKIIMIDIIVIVKIIIVIIS